MSGNGDESPLIIGAPDAHAHASPLDAHRMFLYCCCYNAANAEYPSWSDKLKGSVRRGREYSDSLVSQAAASCAQKWRNLFKRLKKTNSHVEMHGRNQSKSGRFQYDPLSYALNFDDGSVDEDEYSLRAFSARFACPIAKPRETECPLI